MFDDATTYVTSFPTDVGREVTYVVAHIFRYFQEIHVT